MECWPTAPHFLLQYSKWFERHAPRAHGELHFGSGWSAVGGGAVSACAFNRVGAHSLTTSSRASVFSSVTWACEHVALCHCEHPVKWERRGPVWCLAQGDNSVTDRFWVLRSAVTDPEGKRECQVPFPAPGSRHRASRERWARALGRPLLRPLTTPGDTLEPPGVCARGELFSMGRFHHSKCFANPS